MKSTISLAALSCALAGAAMAQDKTLTISIYSFAQDEYKEALYDPFEEICGCDLVIETGNSVERMAKIEANAANPVIDMAVISSHDALSLARKGLIAELDPSKLSNIDKLYPAAQNPLGNNMAVGYTFYASSIVYRKDLVEIDSWGDLLGEDLAGNVALPNITGTQGPLTLMMLAKAFPNGISSSVLGLGQVSLPDLRVRPANSVRTPAGWSQTAGLSTGPSSCRRASDDDHEGSSKVWA